MNGEQAQVVLVAAVAAVVVGVVGLLLAWLVRRLSIRWQLGLAAVVPVAAVLAGVLAASQRMFISDDDVEVVTLVAGAATVVALAVALALSRAITRWSLSLREEVRRVGSGSPYVGGARGPSEFRALSEELATAHARLEEARGREARLEDSRRELVSWVSHDLRTPLAGMRAMTEALEDGMTPDPERYHRQIRVEVDRMVRMVDDLFELSRIHAGVLRLAPEAVVLGDVVSDAIAAADPVARARGVRLGGAVPGGLELVADPSGLSRVVSNLVMNAVRHTPPGGTVHVEGAGLAAGVRAAAGGDCVELVVTDGCGGIGAVDLARVFDVAWQAEPSRTPDDVTGRGAGLGLAIVKGIVEAHRGTVHAEDVTEQGVDQGGRPTGCRFRVVLPVDGPGPLDAVLPAPAPLS
ncbi:sensor histidine kinase [Nocardioides sp. Leaf307]|uniref:sensor histidine kinase n=1 Tax=Nocardioides sp. Leaf307 TaxID=1736331 RepID=UPI000B046B3D|nr:HAMP domain-containing sensor histidine kinase [Nocardioides sp. Leaf307]